MVNLNNRLIFTFITYNIVRNEEACFFFYKTSVCLYVVCSCVGAHNIKIAAYRQVRACLVTPVLVLTSIWKPIISVCLVSHVFPTPERFCSTPPDFFAPKNIALLCGTLNFCGIKSRHFRHYHGSQ